MILIQLYITGDMEAQVKNKNKIVLDPNCKGIFFFRAGWESRSPPSQINRGLSSRRCLTPDFSID